MWRAGAKEFPVCGRYAFYDSRRRIAELLHLDSDEPEFTPHYNITPGTHPPVVWQDDDGLQLRQCLWGFRPPWAGDDAPRPINARAEKVATSPFFRHAFARHRCLVPANGWFEWQTREGKGKVPHYITHAENGELLMFAGIYDPQREDKEANFAIITQPAATPIAHIHPRMPLVLDPGSYGAWLDPSLTERDAIKAAVRSRNAGELLHWAVSTRVNKPDNDDAGIISNEE
ncbi:SOS response-associated peptidase [Aquisalimonas sp. 2447]|uniref:SOS response-associated peptidase n=1 Tax=Aquisalimonas sp. 2447 TaxID=2740807 RepID=UPI0014326283|nr:SOS response-associated peptidase [Aquisalimonas sp. 2447]QIT54513.1 SOS response-associated peptidase [Aquisalimonas sp. 2447]